MGIYRWFMQITWTFVLLFNKAALTQDANQGGPVIGTCLGTPFDTKRFDCCDNFEICPKRHRRCCGKHCYSVGSSLCCDGRIIDKCSQFNSACCGQVCIDENKFACRNGQEIKACAGSVSAWCNDICYNAETHLCCSGKVLARCGYDQSTADCCGSECYNRKTETCCNGAILHPKCTNDQCCEQKCCDTR